MGDFIRNLDWTILLGVIPALLCITIHELAHGYTAYRLGDMTAKNMGRLTLNPIKHIDIFGLLMMVFMRFGWAKPVPVNMRNFKKPRLHMAITALAGPLSNIVLAVIVFFFLGLLIAPLGGFFSPIDGQIYVAEGAGKIAIELIYRAAMLSVALAVFNILPIPPLDGSKVLFSFLPEQTYYKLMRYERFGMIILILLVFQQTIFSATVGGATFTLVDLFAGITRFAYNLVN